MDCIKALLGNQYPQYKTKVIADHDDVEVIVTMELSPTHVALDNPGYLEKKFKKVVPALKSISVTEAKNVGSSNIIGPAITVVMSIKPHFNTLEDIITLSKMAHAIVDIAEDRLSEPEVLQNIGNDCKHWFDDGKDEATA